MKRNKIIKIISLALSIIIVITIVVLKNSYSLQKNENVDEITLARINEIRSTKNTDVSNITGNIYYVSTSGSDSNNGLTKDTPITIAKAKSLMSDKTIKNGDAVLFKRGETFRGNIVIYDNNITLGSYGDEKLAKPKIFGSELDAAKTGSWVEVYTNIWKYQVSGKDKTFSKDVGAIWFFCNEGNNNCDRTSTDGKLKYKFTYKKMTNDNDTESEAMLRTLLTKDMEFYHMGHSSSENDVAGGALYVYSTSNPATRFDSIEISKGTNGIKVGNFHNILIDNLQVSFFGRHGVAINNVANVTVQNCEFSFIGGMIQRYDSSAHWPIRLGNAIQSYGNIEGKTNYPVKGGYVAQNNYIYEIYDAGLTFQYTDKTGKHSKIEKLLYDNNVVEYCSYNIEYWNDTESLSDPAQVNETYLGDVQITNNILRYAGMGFTETRGEHGYEALIKGWDGGSDAWNKVKPGGQFLIENNIFDTTGQLKDKNGDLVGIWMIHISAADAGSLPTIRNNKFYNYRNRNMGYYYSNDSAKELIPYNEHLRFNKSFEGNEFYIYDEHALEKGKKTGTSNEVSYTLDLDKRTLTISGTGKMADYTEDNRPPWYQYKEYISDITIGENVTYIGKYSFDGCINVNNVYLNATNLTDMVNNNYAFTYVGRATTGTTMYIGENVTKIPNQLINSRNTHVYNGVFNKIVFKGNKVKTIGKYAFANSTIEAIVLPDSIEEIKEGAFWKSKSLRVIAFPSKVTTLAKKVLQNSPSLETVILGNSMVTAEADALCDLPKLERIVIPNENFTLPEDVTVINKVNAAGIQLFAPSSLAGAEENLKALGASEAYFIDVKTYRPIIFGDLKNYYVLFDELKYNTSGTYQAKAYTNANVNITGGKYRYVDRFRRIHLIDGLNINTSTSTVSNVVMDVELQGEITNKENKTIDDQNVLYIGNSYTTGFSTQAMAASDVQYDWYYNVNQYLYSLNPNIHIGRVKINGWEEQTESSVRDEQLEKLITESNKQIDPNKTVKTIFLQQSENIGSNDNRRATYEADLDKLVKRYKSEYPEAKIYMTYSYWLPAVTRDIVIKVAQDNDCEIIKIFKGGARSASYIGAKFYHWEHKAKYVSNEGISCHPGDYGFVTIADDVIKYLKENNYAKDSSATSELTSNTYQIKNDTVYVKPTSKEVKVSEVLSKVSSSYTIEAYNTNNVKISVNDYIGTGNKLKTNEKYYAIIILGDTTGDGKIEIGDVAALYNHYRGNKFLKGYYLEAGKLTEGNEVAIGDVAKLYNFYRGKKSL